MKVLDLNGVEITTGATVRRVVNGIDGGIDGEVFHVDAAVVNVDFIGHEVCTFRVLRRFTPRPSYRCLDLKVTAA